MNIINQEEINEIHDLCKQYNIEKYSINSDGTIDVNGHVDLYRKELTSIPLRFNKVSGNFDCSNNKLTSLEGCPNEIGGYFYCGYNELTSLGFCPKEIGRDFYCNNNELTSLEFCPKEIGGNFFCDYNDLPKHFIELYTELSDEEIKIFFKYQHDMRIWDDGYDQEAAQLLVDEIKDGLL